MSHLMNTIVSVYATTSDLSFFTYMGETPMSAVLLITCAVIPLHDPFTDLEPIESVSWNRVLMTS